jgi:tRNA-modifying protein YgfZ
MTENTTPLAALAPLEHEGLLAVSGPDAARFLQGQITCDVNALTVPSSQQGARCNPKGRMQSSFRLLRSADQHYLLAMSAALVERQRVELARYAVFFKAQLADQTLDWVRLGLWGERAPATLEQVGLDVPQAHDQVTAHAHGFTVRVSDLAFELWLVRETCEPLLTQLRTATAPASVEDWQLRAIRDGHGQITELTFESFIPQMLNLQQLGGISFRKGCYTGQEIVARMQYLGTLKRRMYRLRMAGTVAPAPGTAVVDAHSGRTVGEVVNAARSDEGVEILAVMQKDAAQSVLSLNDAEGPLLTPADLPYEPALAASETAGDQPQGTN